MSGTPFPVSIDGRLVPADDARVRVDDPAFTWGLSAFDTLRVEDGAPVLAARHVARLVDTCRRLSIDAPSAERCLDLLREYVRALPRRALAVRTTVARAESERGARTWMSAREIEPIPPEGVVLSVERHVTLAGDELDSLKTSSRVRHALARESARAHGGFDALLRHAQGDVVCATCANVFVVTRGSTGGSLASQALCTPPLARGALAGIVRGVLIEAFAQRGAPVVERALSLDDLTHASEVFVTNSLHGVVPVRSILGMEGAWLGGAGPVARTAREALSELARREN